MHSKFEYDDFVLNNAWLASACWNTIDSESIDEESNGRKNHEGVCVCVCDKLTSAGGCEIGRQFSNIEPDSAYV